MRILQKIISAFFSLLTKDKTRVDFNFESLSSQGSASECVLVCMLAARAQAIARLKEPTCSKSSNNLPMNADLEETVLLGKLMAYCSRESHSCVEKDAMICFVKLRILEPDENSVLRGETLKQVSTRKTQLKLEEKTNFFIEYF